MSRPQHSPPTTPRGQPRIPSASPGPSSPAPAGRPLQGSARRTSGAAGASATPRAAERGGAGAMDLDSVHFNPKLYYQDLIESASLADLLLVQANLAKEIRQLDQEKHDLIYGRHHDLVAASSTIQRMNASTSPLSDSLDSLRSAWSTISQLVESLSLPAPSSSGFTPSSAAGGGSSEQRALARLTRELADLPQTLADLVLLERVAEARALWDSRKPVLDKWVAGGVQGAQEVVDECERALEGVPVDGGRSDDGPGAS